MTAFTNCNNFEWLMLVFMFQPGKRGLHICPCWPCPTKDDTWRPLQNNRKMWWKSAAWSLARCSPSNEMHSPNAAKWMQQVAWQGSGNNCRGLQTWVGGDVIRFCGWRRTLRDHTRDGRLQAKFDEHTAGSQDSSCSCNPTDIRWNQPL